MGRICIKSRDELVVVDTEKLAYVLADGNYCKMVYIEGLHQMISLGMSKIADILKGGEPNPAHPVFLRLGRSLLINQRYLLRISIPNQKIILSDFGKNTHGLSVPKQLLKQYKEEFETLQRSESAE